MATKKQAMAEMAVKRGRGRPTIPDDIKRRPTTVRLSPRVLEHFQRNPGDHGWQRELDAVLNEYIDYMEGSPKAA
jgi:uncharacterized protein (DUF4415 family)